MVQTSKIINQHWNIFNSPFYETSSEETFEIGLEFQKMASNFVKRPLATSKWSKLPMLWYSLSTFLILYLLIPHTLWLNELYKTASNFFKRPLVASKWPKPPKSSISIQTFLFPHLLRPQLLKSKKLLKSASNFGKWPLMASKCCQNLQRTLYYWPTHHYASFEPFLS